MQKASYERLINKIKILLNQVDVDDVMGKANNKLIFNVETKKHECGICGGEYNTQEIERLLSEDGSKIAWSGYCMDCGCLWEV